MPPVTSSSFCPGSRALEPCKAPLPIADPTAGRDTVQLPEVRDRPATRRRSREGRGHHRGREERAADSSLAGMPSRRSPPINSRSSSETLEIGPASRVLHPQETVAPDLVDPHQSTELHDDDVAVCDRLAERQDRALVPRCRTSGAEASPRGDPGRIRSSAGKPSQGARMGMDESSNAMMWRPSFTAWDGISTRRSSPLPFEGSMPNSGTTSTRSSSRPPSPHPVGTRQAP